MHESKGTREKAYRNKEAKELISIRDRFRDSECAFSGIRLGDRQLTRLRLAVCQSGHHITDHERRIVVKRRPAS